MNEMRDFRSGAKTTGFVMSWWLWIIAIVFGISIVVGGINFVSGWLSQPARIYSAENVREQWRFAYEYNQSLSAIQGQYCTADRAVNDSVDSTERSQRVTQRIAIENNYARVAAKYNAALQNAFEAKLVRPSDVPQSAPELNRSCSSS